MPDAVPGLLQGHVFDFWGVFVSSFTVDSALALAVLLVLRPLLARLRFPRLVWNPPLAELGLLVCLIGLFVLTF